MNIQIVMDEGIGNMVKMTPAIRGIKKQLPDARITVLCKPPADQVIRGWALVDKVITEPDNREYDLTYMSIWSANYAQKYKDDILGNSREVRKVPIRSLEVNEAFLQLAMAQEFGFTGSLPKPYCRWTVTELPWRPDAKVAILADTAHASEEWQRKRWNKYPALAKRLIALGYTVVLIGGQTEADNFDHRDWPEGVISALGKYSIPETAYLLKHCDVFVGNDSGPGHIAAAMGTRTIVLFGATKVRKNKPLGCVSVLTANLSCSPCQYTPEWEECSRWRCMEEISVSQVLSEVENPATQSDRPTISACMIVKDEEKNLGRCLESIKDLVDEMVIVDTGSTDKTVAIAESYGARVYHFPWTGSFSEARNESLKYPTKDWVLCIDADEWIDPGEIEKIQKGIKRVEDEGIPINAIIGDVISELRGGSSSRMQREFLFRRGVVHYENRVHNQPVYPGNNLIIGLQIQHSGYALSSEEQGAKQKRTELLLLKELEDKPFDPPATMNILRVYRGQRRWDDLLAMSEAFYKKTNGTQVGPVPDQMIRIDTMAAYQGLAGEYDEQKKTCASGEVEALEVQSKAAWNSAVLEGEALLAKYPDNLDAAFYLAMVYRIMGKHEEAIKTFGQYIAIHRSIDHTPGKVVVMQDTWGAMGQAWNNMGLCEYELGFLSKAVMDVWVATDIDPANEHFVNNLNTLWGTAIRVMHETGKTATASIMQSKGD